MQRLICFLLFLPTVFFAKAAEENRIIPPFNVLKSEKDASIPAGKAVFHFIFRSPSFVAIPGNPDYPVIMASCDGNYMEVKQDDNLWQDHMVDAGIHVFQFYAYTMNNHYYEIYSDSVTIQPGYRTTVELNFQESHVEIMVDKPVVYLYPETDLEFCTEVTPRGEFSFTYPAYENGWHGTAHPDGSMTIAGKNYPYLFWDAKMQINQSDMKQDEGFIVHKDQVVAFLEQKLTQMGFSSREQTDFITYWGPRLTQEPMVFIQFAWNDACDRFAEMDIYPQPDHVNRLYILWTAVGKQPDFKVVPQQLPVFDRSGFDVLEWGGSEVPFQFIETKSLSSNR